MKTFIYNPKSLFGGRGQWFDDDWYPRLCLANDSSTVIATDDSIDVSMDLPGFTRSDIQIRYENDYVTVCAENTESNRSPVKKTVYVGAINVKKSTSSLENGVLTIQLEKAASVRPQTIDVG